MHGGFSIQPSDRAEWYRSENFEIAQLERYCRVKRLQTFCCNNIVTNIGKPLSIGVSKHAGAAVPR